MEEDEKTPRKSWDLMIGITLIILGSFRLYNRLQEDIEIDFRVLLTVIFIIYGGYLIFRHFQNSDHDQPR